MKYFKLLLVIILVLVLPHIANAYAYANSCGDEYINCSKNCYNEYNNCHNEYINCINDCIDDEDCKNDCLDDYKNCINEDCYDNCGNIEDCWDGDDCFITVCYSSYSSSFDITEKEKIAAKKATWKKVKVKRISVLNRCLTFINNIEATGYINIENISLLHDLRKLFETMSTIYENATSMEQLREEKYLEVQQALSNVSSKLEKLQEIFIIALEEDVEKFNKHYKKANAEIGNNNKYSDDKKRDIFNKDYKDRWFIWFGMVVSSTSNSALLDIDDGVLSVIFSDSKAGYDLEKGDLIKVRFLLKELPGSHGFKGIEAEIVKIVKIPQY